MTRRYQRGLIYVGLVIGLLGGLSHSEPAHAASLWPGWNWVTEIAGTGKGFYDWFVDKILQLPYLSDSERNRLSSKAKEAKTVTEKETIINEAKAENQLAKHQTSLAENQVPSIIQAPSFTFTDCPVSENAVTTPLQSNPATPSTLEVQAPQSQKWRVEVSLSAFQLQETSQRPVPTLLGAAIQLGSKDQAASGPRTLLTPNSVSGSGNQSIDLSSTTLSLPPVAYAGRYQANLTYTLIVDGS